MSCCPGPWRTSSVAAIEEQTSRVYSPEEVSSRQSAVQSWQESLLIKEQLELYGVFIGAHSSWDRACCAYEKVEQLRRRLEPWLAGGGVPSHVVEGEPLEIFLTRCALLNRRRLFSSIAPESVFRYEKGLEYFLQVKKIKHLEYTGEQAPITAISSLIEHCQKLEVVRLSKNALEYVPGAVGSLRLRELDVSHNCIRDVSPDFSHLNRSLKVLKIERNPIEELPRIETFSFDRFSADDMFFRRARRINSKEIIRC